MPSKFETLSSRTIFSNPYWEYRMDEYHLLSGKKKEYHYVWSRGSTFIIPEIDDDTYILTRQWRYLNKRYSIEFPGGGIEKGLSPSENAVKELAEETGYVAGSMIYLGEYNPFNGVTNELCQVFIARNLLPCDCDPDESEEIELIRLNRKEIYELIKKGEIWDGMTLAAWAMYSFHY
jgi:8-oxo-dGTP pyrophosphatase MutT (NUDIX family)